ncbi:GNAT family N-acetyltransferase [Leptospira sp. 201903070]|jgi:RimJ/RimL family protein N-acetyltransferase|uniref:GNAT family N-acetyltransferase n=1 Tax=Leptospira ainlahdjerensis TaxID=2810033 RepID=A0ABS2UBR5_9LEPT|nr:GNAT family N-acetyltransferase [Leptospira ainlahdjerensis]MBM9577812.1 GNAT family N-acetyltransferase [Leptospira ainlahdjerensis]
MQIEKYRITLEASTLEDRRRFYNWLVHPELVKFMMGPPIFPEIKIPSWEEFQEDYEDYFFTGTRPDLGRCYRILKDGAAIGQINYAIEMENSKIAELDIWLSDPKECGHGFGTRAVRILSRILFEEFSLDELVIRPSERNPRAVRVYEKAGFRKAEIDIESANRLYGKGDYYDDVVLILKKDTFYF